MVPTGSKTLEAKGPGPHKPTPARCLCHYTVLLHRPLLMTRASVPPGARYLQGKRGEGVRGCRVPCSRHEGPAAWEMGGEGGHIGMLTRATQPTNPPNKNGYSRCVQLYSYVLLTLLQH